jgi:SAM-dependent methyltransferase
VLDVGCGCGDTTLALAKRVGSSGSVLGLDISGPMLSRARERAAAGGLTNLRFQQADAQTVTLEERFDVLFSRFGVMFFEMPDIAFANLRRALRPGARLAFVCWQPLGKNPWMAVPLAAVAPLVTLPPPTPGAPGPFAFADPAHVRRILERAGFSDVGFEAVEEVLDVGPGDLDGSVRFVLALGPAAAALREAPDAAALEQKATIAVRAALAPHMTPDGLRMSSASWIVTARNPKE